MCATFLDDREQETGARESQAGEHVDGVKVKSRRHLLVNVGTICVSIGFSYIALSSINLDTALQALRTSNYWWLLPALLAFALGNIARALRWRALFARGRRPPAAATLNATIVGYFYNNIMPARAGEAARVLVLKQRSASPPFEITGTIVLERMYDLIGLLVVFFIAVPWLPHVSWFKAAAIFAILLTVVIAILTIVLMVFHDRPLRLLLRPFRRFSPFSDERLERTLDELIHGLSGLRSVRVAIEAFLWTIVAWAFTMVCAYVVTLAFHLHLSLACGVLIVVAIGLSMVLPSPPAAVGVFEGATLLALGAYKVPHDEALPYAVVLHLLNFIPFVLMGFVVLHYNARHPVVSHTSTEVAG